jgi:hypothetical protein
MNILKKILVVVFAVFASVLFLGGISNADPMGHNSTMSYSTTYNYYTHYGYYSHPYHRYYSFRSPAYRQPYYEFRLGIPFSFSTPSYPYPSYNHYYPYYNSEYCIGICR